MKVRPDKEVITTPIYDIWSRKVVDATVSYIEPNDKKFSFVY